MENALVVASNLYALRTVNALPLFSPGSVLTLLAMLASMLYHGVERHRHGMPGLFGSGTLREQCLCINIDRACAALLCAWLLIVAREPAHFYLAAPALMLLALSEAPHFAPRAFAKFGKTRARHFYMTFHIAWHLAAFHLTYLVATHR